MTGASRPCLSPIPSVASSKVRQVSGTPVAIAAAMLVGLGFTPLWGAGVARLPILLLLFRRHWRAHHRRRFRFWSGPDGRQLHCRPPAFPAGPYRAFLGLYHHVRLQAQHGGFAGNSGFRHLLCSRGIFAFQFHGPHLPDIGSAIASIVGLVLLLKVWRPKQTFRFEGEAPARLEGNPTRQPRFCAWGPYLVLAVFVFFWGSARIQEGSQRHFRRHLYLWLACPGWRNFQDCANCRENTVYAAKYTFNWLSAGGTAIFLSGLVSIPLMPKYGFGRGIACFFRTIRQLVLPILTIAPLILGLAYLMNYSGMSASLGLAFTPYRRLLPLLRAYSGLAWRFLTGSDTSSCALFGGMQRDTAIAVGMSPELAVASNASGGTTAR